MGWWEGEASGMKRPVESSNGYGEKCVVAGWYKRARVKKTMQRGQVFPMSDQSVMCEIKRDPMPQGEDNCVSASRWQAAVEVKLEVEAVQSA